MEVTPIVVLVCLSSMVQYAQQAAVMPPPDGHLHVYGLPVGQGDGTIIQCPNGDISIVDLGSTTRTQIEGDYMTDAELAAFLGTYTQRLKYIFISHADLDHFNLLPKLNVHPRTVTASYLGCNKNDYPTPIMNWIISVANAVVADPSINTVVSICGPTIPQVNIRVLASNTDVYSTKDCSNGDSLVLRLEYGTFTLLLPGDLEDYPGFTYDQNGYITSSISGAHGKRGVLRTVIDNWAKRSGGIASAVYRFAHHGTWPNGNKPFFVHAVQPQYAFSSSKLPGTAGTFNHPNCELYDNMVALAKGKVIPLQITKKGFNQQIDYYCGKDGYRYKEDENIYGIYTTAAATDQGKLLNYYIKMDSDGTRFQVVPLPWR